MRFLQLVTDRQQTRGRPLADVVSQALAGGVTVVQLREKDLPVRDLLSLALILRDLTAAAGARLLINGRVDLCLAAEADGVHLPADGLPVETARELLGPDRWVGRSIHHPGEARAAASGGATYVTIGPIYSTPSKAAFGPPLGPEVLKGLRVRAKIPILAVGGITPDRVREVLAHGADGVAVIRAISDAADVTSAARSFAEALTP